MSCKPTLIQTRTIEGFNAKVYDDLFVLRCSVHGEIMRTTAGPLRSVQGINKSFSLAWERHVSVFRQNNGSGSNGGHHAQSQGPWFRRFK